MITNRDPRDLADALTRRSICAVQVSAILADSRGVFAWGWNSMGADGLGEHAEAHCLRRANRRRASRGTLYVAARRRRNNKVITARPCARCAHTIQGVNKVVFRDADGLWKRLK